MAKETTSLMIEPTIYEQIKLLASINKRNISAEVEIAFKKHLQDNNFDEIQKKIQEVKNQ